MEAACGGEGEEKKGRGLKHSERREQGGAKQRHGESSRSQPLLLIPLNSSHSVVTSGVATGDPSSSLSLQVFMLIRGPFTDLTIVIVNMIPTFSPLFSHHVTVEQTDVAAAFFLSLCLQPPAKEMLSFCGC